MSTLAQVQLAAVNGPPAVPPTVGLVATAQIMGSAYLIDDEVEMVDTEVNDSQGRLLDTVRQVPQRWVGGFRYVPETLPGPTYGVVRDPCVDSQEAVPASSSFVIGIPVQIETGDTCSAFGWTAHNYRERAERRLLAVESRLIATEFWAGAIAQASSWDNQWLAAGGAVDVVYGSAQAPGVALALLEEALGGGPGAPGVIHCTRQLGAALSELGNTFKSVQGLIQTYMGTTIIPDAGYPGTGPTGQAVSDGSQWAYATLPPQVRRSPLELYPENFYEALDRSTNTVAFRAIRYMTVSYDPCVLAAAQVNLPLKA